MLKLFEIAISKYIICYILLSILLIGLIRILVSSNVELNKFLAAVVLGNLAIGIVIRNLHIFYTTRRYDEQKDFYLKNVTNLLESFLYALLFGLNMYTLLAGVLIAKTVGSAWSNKKNKDESNDESRKVAIFRFGLALQILLVIGASILLKDIEGFNSLASYFNLRDE